MFGIVGKIKTYIIGTLVFALPILYAFGRIKGKEAEKNKVLRDELDNQHKVSNFYKNMAEHEDDPSTNDRRNFSQRLRNKGL